MKVTAITIQATEMEMEETVQIREINDRLVSSIVPVWYSVGETPPQPMRVYKITTMEGPRSYLLPVKDSMIFNDLLNISNDTMDHAIKRLTEQITVQALRSVMEALPRWVKFFMKKSNPKIDVRVKPFEYIKNI